jgi:hypothetical protein
MKNLELTDQEINTVLYGLQKLPYENVAGIIPKIVKQAQDQQPIAGAEILKNAKDKQPNIETR